MINVVKKLLATS